MRHIFRRLGRDERGSVLTYMIVVPVLAGTAALGIETGQFYTTKRKMQNAADGAAIAGAIDRLAGKGTTTIATDASFEAQRNGFTSGSGGVTVTVNSPPSSGPNVSTTGAVEVIVTKSQSFSLGGVLNAWLGGTNSAYTLKARSVAAQGSYSTSTTSYEGCLVALTSAAEQGLSFTSFNNFTSDCTVISNGTASAASSSASVYMSSFNNATLKSVWTRGSFYYSSYNHLTLTNTAQTNQTTSVVDPNSGLGTPSAGSCTYTNFNAGSGSSITLSPGTYCGGLTVSSYSNVYFTAGTYYIANGDLVIGSVSNVSCSNCTGGAGTTFVLTQTTGNNSDIGGVNVSSLNNVTLNAPNSGTYAGLVFFQDKRANVGTISSTSKIFQVTSLNNATLYGGVYFPNNRINISSINNTSASSSTGCSVLIGRYITLTSYNNNWIAGCSSYGTTAAGIVTTTTVSKAKVLE